MKYIKLCAFGLLASALSAGAAEPLVIGQSLPLSGAGYRPASRVLAGAKAQVDRVNASGGINGRRIELITLDDGGNPKRHAANLRQLVQQDKAVAIVNCLGERACLEAAQATLELQVPLIGPISGALALREPEVRHVYSLRPDDVKEAEALVRQLQSIGISRTVLMTDSSEPARTKALADALARAGVQVTRMAVDASMESIDTAFRNIATVAPQALVVNLGNEVMEILGQLSEANRKVAPTTIATLSSAGLTHLTRLFRDSVIGYTAVVPNPDLTQFQLPIVRELQRDSEAFTDGEALTFEGLESYLNLRICTEALRRAGTKLDGQRLGESIESLGSLDLGGIRLSFGRQKHHASDKVEIGIRTRDGRFLQ
jgi:branched-chain amino acid transport system substrate-binding protein